MEGRLAQGPFEGVALTDDERGRDERRRTDAQQHEAAQFAVAQHAAQPALDEEQVE